MAESPTYVFDDDGKVYAYVDEKLVAMAGNQEDLDGFEQRIAAPPMPMPAPGGAAPVGGPPEPSPGGPDGPPMDEMHDEEPEPAGMHVVFEGELKPAPKGDDADPLPDAAPDTIPGDDLPPRATHIVT